jgi:hypothetical protein
VFSMPFIERLSPETVYCHSCISALPLL